MNSNIWNLLGNTSQATYLFLALAMACLTACNNPDENLQSESKQTTVTPQPLPKPHYVGGKHCQSCHGSQYADWQGSHHDLAMQEINDESVLGDFNHAQFEYAGVTTEFFRENGQFMIRTEGPNGALKTYPVAYTFGVYPLQQYLLALPGGRLQAFGIAWDSRPEEEGGQRWFHLYPNEQVSPQDPLHWTKHSQNWNFMCAECHSTHLEKNYRPRGRTYNTQWSDIDVSCEACHGPASNHLLWAKEERSPKYRFDGNKGLTHLFNEREGVHWSINKVTGQPQRSQARPTATEIQVCAACHSRRSQFFEDDRHGQPLLASFLPSTLESQLYYSDGQIHDEVYVYGSFLQSKMYQAGVTCSDCHNPHALSLKAPGEQVCLQCHTAKYASQQHHHHKAHKNSPQCVDCHMPSKYFMVIDERRDHSFRIPRPDLSATLGVPNTCNSCHSEQSAPWAAQHLEDWYGQPNPGSQPFAEVFSAARNGRSDAKPSLQALAVDTTQPAIIRATAARLLESYLDQDVLKTLSACLQDSDPLVRVSATQALSVNTLPAELRWQILKPLLYDSIKMVRVMVAEQLSDIPRGHLSPDDQHLLQQATQEYLASQAHNADSPQSQLNRGLFSLHQGNVNEALNHYQEAIALDDTWLPAYVNLADLYRLMEQDDKGKAVLQDALQRFPDSADVHYSLGLLFVRQLNQPEGLKHLKKAAQLAPQNARYQYVYAVGLHSAGQIKEALWVTRAALQNHQTNDLIRLEQQLDTELTHHNTQ
ncbi:multiheme c-type cytochrome [Nitrosococcus watsonii]|uniref:Doubled CXXCH domain protein n=1 Tax=Nitrosococcus watsoni (strain C-113) TaxID=105559 RepID=D8KBD1_NITWC|nr:multiheme c-type cytochrome [Nitrosococcus watsonii]ADJ29578.1 doubled CXXCH domain protein [Nitrosococcus watsonii C-113]